MQECLASTDCLEESKPLLRRDSNIAEGGTVASCIPAEVVGARSGSQDLVVGEFGLR